LLDDTFCGTNFQRVTSNQCSFQRNHVPISDSSYRKISTIGEKNGPNAKNSIVYKKENGQVIFADT
jgi:hypothetical protein